MAISTNTHLTELWSSRLLCSLISTGFEDQADFLCFCLSNCVIFSSICRVFQRVMGFVLLLNVSCCWHLDKHPPYIKRGVYDHTAFLWFCRLFASFCRAVSVCPNVRGFYYFLLRLLLLLPKRNCIHLRFGWMSLWISNKHDYCWPFMWSCFSLFKRYQVYCGWLICHC